MARRKSLRERLTEAHEAVEEVPEAEDSKAEKAKSAKAEKDAKADGIAVLLSVFDAVGGDRRVSEAEAAAVAVLRG